MAPNSTNVGLRLSYSLFSIWKFYIHSHFSQTIVQKFYDLKFCIFTGITLIFYACFYAGLALLFSICMKGMLATLSNEKPKWTLSSSLIGTNPGKISTCSHFVLSVCVKKLYYKASNYIVKNYINYYYYHYSCEASNYRSFRCFWKQIFKNLFVSFCRAGRSVRKL